MCLIFKHMSTSLHLQNVIVAVAPMVLKEWVAGVTIDPVKGAPHLIEWAEYDDMNMPIGRWSTCQD